MHEQAAETSTAAPSLERFDQRGGLLKVGYCRSLISKRLPGAPGAEPLLAQPQSILKVAWRYCVQYCRGMRAGSARWLPTGSPSGQWPASGRNVCGGNESQRRQVTLLHAKAPRSGRSRRLAQWSGNTDGNVFQRLVDAKYPLHSWRRASSMPRSDAPPGGIAGGIRQQFGDTAGTRPMSSESFSLRTMRRFFTCGAYHMHCLFHGSSPNRPNSSQARQVAAHAFRIIGELQHLSPTMYVSMMSLTMNPYNIAPSLFASTRSSARRRSNSRRRPGQRVVGGMEGQQCRMTLNHRRAPLPPVAPTFPVIGAKSSMEILPRRIGWCCQHHPSRRPRPGWAPSG